ncbi:MAG: sigma 54-interacting transcriptional regulator [Desulfobacterales bacterium]|nr:sigma 54-interacting transcriptional regulator [Desulfobacterales bacterium]
MDFKDLQSWLLDAHIPSVQDFLDLFQEGIVIINKKGKVTYINDSYCKFLRVSKRAAIGNDIQKIIPTTGFWEVMKSGRPQYKRYHVYADNREVIANRIPIFIDGKLEGMVGEVLLKSRSELDEVIKNFAILNEKIKHTERQIDKHIYTSVYNFDDIVSEDESILRMKNVAAKAARSVSPVLLEGESGTGKELFAHSIHSAGNRSHGPFIRLNCAAIPAELLEAELFGYEKGAFTGASNSGKPGKFELADKGVIFLDEIGDMPLSMQSKLLRVLEEGQITRLGDTKPIKIDFICIAATNKNLESMISQNLFRLDLFFRLSVVRMHLPPLRELPKTLTALCDKMLKEKALSAGLLPKQLSSDAIKLLKKYNWPGNVRELSNVIESAVNMSENRVISVSELPRRLLAKAGAAELKNRSTTNDLSGYLQTAEAEYIKDILKEMNYNVSATAKILGIHRTWLYQKIKKYNIPIR